MISEDLNKKNTINFISSGILLLLILCYSLVFFNILDFSDNKYVIMGIYGIELIIFIIMSLGPIGAINSIKKQESINILAKKELEKLFNKIYNEKRVPTQNATGSYSETNLQKESSPSSIPPPPPPESMIATGSPDLPLPEISMRDLRYQSFVESKWFDEIYYHLNTNIVGEKRSYIQLYQDTLEKIKLLIAIDTLGQLILRHSQRLIFKDDLTTGINLILTKKEHEVLAYSREKILLYREFLFSIAKDIEKEKKVYRLLDFNTEWEFFEKSFTNYRENVDTNAEEFLKLYTSKLQAFGIKEIDDPSHVHINNQYIKDFLNSLFGFIFFNLLLVLLTFFLSDRELNGSLRMLILKEFWIGISIFIFVMIYIYLKTHIIAKIASFYETMSTKYTMGLMFVFIAIEFIKMTYIYTDSFVLIVRTFFYLASINSQPANGAEITITSITAVIFGIVFLAVFSKYFFVIFFIPTIIYYKSIESEFSSPKLVFHKIQEISTEESGNTILKETAHFLGFIFTIGLSIALLILKLIFLFSGKAVVFGIVFYTNMVIGIFELIGVLLLAINFFLSVKECSTEYHIYFPTISTTLATPLPQTTMEPIR
ncbi:MAG: hypothetical protein ACTSXA_11655 [Candidatus Heimdallarchaeota archaeon]